VATVQEGKGLMIEYTQINTQFEIALTPEKQNAIGDLNCDQNQSM